MSTKPSPMTLNRASGFTLIEIIMFIVIISVALTGVLAALNLTTKSSADPLIRKQMMTIAETLVDEVQMRPFTYCDGGPSPCVPTQIFGHDAGTDRPTYTSVTNYCTEATTTSATCSTITLGTPNDASSTIPDLSGIGATSPPGYWATISLTAQALGGIASTNTAAGLNAVLITVTVSTTRTSETITLQGYRTRWAPEPS